jgi:alanine dehydrogenase
MGADVAVLDRNPEALRRVDAVLGNRVCTLFSTRDVVELLCPRADLVIATVNGEGGENRRDGELRDD